MRSRDARQSESELALVRRCVRGDADAWTEMIQQYGALIAHAARTTLQRVAKSVDPNQVEEAAQAVWASLCEDRCRRLRSYAGQAALSTWLTILATRRTLDAIRTERRKGSLKHLPLETEEANLLNDLRDGQPGTEPFQEEETRLVWEALNRLSGVDRLILKLYYVDGLSYRTIAHLMKVAPNTVSSYIFRAREKLRQLLSRHP